MENTFEQAQREWLLEKYPELQAKALRLEYELEMARQQIAFKEEMLKQKSDIISELTDTNDKLLTLINEG